MGAELESSPTVPPDVLDVGLRDVTFGERVTVVRPCNLYECELDDDVFVGPFVEIQRGVVVGRRSRIQSHAFVCEGVTLGEDVFVSHGVCFVNDPFSSGRRAGGDRTMWRDTVVGDRVLIGSGATLLPVRICDDAVIGAGAVVTKDIEEPGIYVGNPARLLRRT